MLGKGFSNTDNKYVLLFKRRPLLIKTNSDINIKSNIETFEKPNISTTKKLKQIISNLPNNKKNIRKKFLFDNNFNNDYNIFHSKIKDLLKKNQSIEKKQFIQKVDRLDGISESINRLKKYKKRFALDENIVKLKIKENKKTPPICNYNPNLESISKHVPIPDLMGHHHINLVKIKKEEEEKKRIAQQNNLNNFYDNEMLIEDNYIINTNNKKNNSTISINPYEYKNIIPKTRVNNRNIYSNSMNSMESRIYYSKNYENPISHSISAELTPINPKKIKNYVSVPIFKKMISRDKNNYLYNHCYLADYFPNYNSIDSNAYRFININENLKNKKNKLRKIMTCSNPPSEYVLLPILNKITIK